MNVKVTRLDRERRMPGFFAVATGSASFFRVLESSIRSVTSSSKFRTATAIAVDLETGGAHGGFHV